MKNNEFKHWFKERKFNRSALYFELVYVAILLLVLVFNFTFFMYLLVAQFIIIGVYFLIGSFLDSRAINPARKAETNRRDTFWQTITSFHFTKTTWLRIFEIIVFIVAFAVAIYFFYKLWADLGVRNKALKTTAQNLCNSLTIDLDFVYVLAMGSMGISILLAGRHILRFLSIASFILAFLLYFLHPESYLVLTFGLIASSSGFWLCQQSKI